MKIKLFVIVVLTICLTSCAGCSKSGRKAESRKVTSEFLALVEDHPKFSFKKEDGISYIFLNEKTFSFKENRRGEYDVYMNDSLNSFKLDRRQSGDLVEKIRDILFKEKMRQNKKIDEAFRETIQ